MKLILTSSLDLSSKDKDGKRVAHNFGNENGILDLIKRQTSKRENFLFVASSPSNYEATDAYASVTFESFGLTFPFNNYTILDGRTKQNAKELVESADLIFLCGGHVPTQNEFFKNINLREIIKNSSALIIGQSAGSMNSAEIVYAQPELEGEAINPNYKRYLQGLGLTKISILPHFEQELGTMLDGKDVFKEISLPDSQNRPFIAYSDGAFIYDNGETQQIYGKAYLFDKGYQKISEDNTITDITELVDDIFGYANYNLIKE